MEPTRQTNEHNNLKIEHSSSLKIQDELKDAKESTTCLFPLGSRLFTFVILLVVIMGISFYTFTQQRHEMFLTTAEEDMKSEHIILEQRDVLADIRTSFVPPPLISLPDEEYYTEDGQNNDVVLHRNIFWNPQSTSDDYQNMLQIIRLGQNSDKKASLQNNKPYLTSNEDWFFDYEEKMKGEHYADLETFIKTRENGGLNKRRREVGEEKCEGNKCQKDESLPSTSLQSFWGHNGTPEAVREHQSKIMRQYMDTTADPCQDFYQYACGNWATLNPIPSDKAGYDTFEMLRENLDQVLKQLLTSDKVKKWENVPFLADVSVVHKYLQMEPLRIIAKLDYLEEDDRHYVSKEENDLNERRKRNSKNSTRQIEYVGVFRNKRDIVLNSEDGRQASKINFINKRHRMRRTVGNIVGGEVRATDGESEKSEDEKVFYDSMDAITKAKYLYESCMNYDILEKREHQPLLDLLNKLGGWPMLDPHWNGSDFDWLELIGILRLFNNDILLSEWVGPDIRKSDEFIVQFDQSHLGLPLPDYYLQDSYKDFLDAYNQYIISIAVLMGVDPEIANKSTSEMLLFEKELAKIIIPPENRRNISELYQRLTVKELSEAVPKINWKRYMCVVLNRTVSWNESVVMYATKYAKDLANLIDKTPPRVVANYILWRFIRHRVNNLDDKFQDAKQKFYNKLFGRETSPPRWKNCVAQVNSNMGMALGSLFVSKYFDENSKNDTLVMTREIQDSFRELLNMTSWIDEDTKTLATDKVDAMMLRIGYPDFVLNQDELNERYKDVSVHPDRYFENTLNILRHLTKTEHAKLGQTVNKTQWNTAPAIVNAYYSRNKNQILFPAGILQPPFYHKHFPKCLNFGGIGVVIGHEITHGFDDKGRLFDKHGNLQRWWPEAAIHLFHKKAQCLIDQYSDYQVSEVSMALDGISTQGENIADNGGIKQAYRAYKHWVRQNNHIEESLPGINATSSQLFFLNFAQIWCGVMRPEAMKNKLKVAVHSPGRFRVIGTVSNSQDFAKAFNCPIDTPMNPVKKCDVW